MDAEEGAGHYIRTRRTRARVDDRNAILFVHGYNNSFADAAKSIALLYADAEFSGIPVLVSWPSQNTRTVGAASYRDAQENASNTRWLAEDALRHLAGNGVGRVDLIAHSMGNVVAARAFARIAYSDSFFSTQMGFFISAAGDVAAHQFRRIHQTSKPSQPIAALRGVIYCSEKDMALNFSWGINNNVRLGDCRWNLHHVAGFETVKVVGSTPNGADALYHSYVFREPATIRDIRGVIKERVSAVTRGLKSVEGGWELVIAEP